jgi:transcriptional regulator with XRE-family HTH domain
VKSTGNKIRKRRQELGLTLEQLAAKVGSTRQKVWRLETDMTRVLADDVRLFAKALKTTVEDLCA